MLFWGGIYITISPLTSDSTYSLPVGNFTIDVEPTTNDIAACYKTYVRPIFQVGLGAVRLITHAFGLLAMLCFGNEIDSITTCFCPPPNGTKLDDGFLARLDAALTLGSILTRGFAIMRAVLLYIVHSSTFLGVTDSKKEYCDKRFQVSDGTNGIEPESDEMVGVCRQAGSKFLQGIESGYASTGEDDISGEYCITGGDGRSNKE